MPAVSPVDANAEPAADCGFCPRLAAFRDGARARFPGWHNAPVPSFGPQDARLLIVGLAPGLKGANRTGRPFTGDYAGDLLYATLIDFGFARGVFDARPDDGLELLEARITNAVRCVPPENKPNGAEIAACRPFLATTIGLMPHLRVMVALGRIAHESTLRALQAPLARYPFGHGRAHPLTRPDGAPVTLFDSFHCSRYNTNTGRLTPQMFHAVFATVRETLDAAR